MTVVAAPQPVSLRSTGSLDLMALRAAYQQGLTPSALIGALIALIESRPDDNVWIHRVSREDLEERAATVEAQHAAGEDLPLYGVPFAVKDNIDVAGLPTTAGCPAFAYTPAESAPAVQRLLDAGAILLGKTNLDQFATGLVGVRSPYGVPVNPFDSAYIPGGSSSGSAVAVAAGLVSFALGTDTAGSGRVPASFNNIVGLKPSRGLLSTRGVVPACRTLDCVSVFALTAPDAAMVLDVAGRYDAADPYARPVPPDVGDAAPAASLSTVRLGVPAAAQLDFFGDDEAAALFAQAADLCRAADAEVVEIDFAPFAQAAALLYGGAWVAERYAAVGDFIEAHPAETDPVVAGIVLGGAAPTARDAFAAQYALADLRRQADAVLETVDALLLPTAGTIYTVAQVAADPVALNTNLGVYTNFMNLLDMAGIAVPTGFRANGLPFGVTLAAPAFRDRLLCRLGGDLHRAAGLTLGATGHALPAPAAAPPAVLPEDRTVIAVFGAHMRGQPLNAELVRLGGALVGPGRTSAAYRLLSLPGASPARPGLVRTPEGGGRKIELELWSLPRARVGDLLAQVAPPLGFGTVELEDGRQVAGFICEGYAAADSEDITGFGGWRAYLAATQGHAVEA